MSRLVRFLLPLVALGLPASSAQATDLAHVKCAVNQDRVWVYDSLGNFDVAERLHCGAAVEILAYRKGYVKVRTESGVEGYVPDNAFPEPPSMPEENKTQLASTTPRPLAAEPRTPAPAVSRPAEPLVAAAAKPATPVVSPAKPMRPAAVAPEPAMISSVPVPVKVSAPTQPVPPITVSAKVSTPPTQAKPATTVVKNPEVAASTSPTPFPAHTTALAANAPVAPAKPSIETVNSSLRDSATMVPATAVPSAAPIEESDEYPRTQPENESADPACRVYFAVYGLTPSQYKWLAENRRTEFSEICPAPDVAHVDYVILLTHDSDSYTYAMPTPVHVDRNGFSDFSALTTVDTALVTSSQVQRAHYEFAWVFRVTRGAFDPGRFSAWRKPQFTTSVKGTRASSRSIEDAFGYVRTQGVDR